ncbi:zinc finger and BTB domain-containing protein 25-like [Myxocyprinus asiaticus]|uniref:zinc finger and BTB domain-containing protein 25-like n=1 Tax=Myxocyprinus asiaticus TaxID=70543 RepID=UPI0022222129|nr:zinc finger and BTB domain-containing protein 25-like [Myxocyprinus asiaticus]XP_051511811.1 zinc finger and BTB domain-containing protein 25-like [Myxocyprinus asiaticus]XP_051511812.1 zinc finger and BTB domain-containing protein 25-like [Myxocyprinus asiaticus]
MDVSGHSLLLLQQLNVQREFGFLCDCTVAIGNVYFKAHRAVLAAFSNYFKMIFIHQSSECIKIQPTDIQPDVFSYLLHIMYTGMGPKQPIDQGRLQEGIKFLHAYQLCRKTGEGGPDLSSDNIRASNLYGIQISSQLANKENSGLKAGGSRDPEDGRSSTRADRTHGRLTLAVGLEGITSERQPQSFHAASSVASGDDPDISTQIKQERIEEEEEQQQQEGEKEPCSLSPTQVSPCQAGLFKDGPLALLCPRCGERCLSPEGLQEHLFTHAACALEPSSLMEGPSEIKTGEHKERVDAGSLEEALRQSQSLADELAVELRRGGGTGRSVSPLAAFTRKRKMACAVCNLRFSQKSQLQEHMFAHVGKPLRYHRYSRFCGQLLHGCESQPDITAATGEEVGKDTLDNGSSCYSLDSEVSQESVDAVTVE